MGRVQMHVAFVYLFHLFAAAHQINILFCDLNINLSDKQVPVCVCAYASGYSGPFNATKLTRRTLNNSQRTLVPSAPSAVVRWCVQSEWCGQCEWLTLAACPGYPIHILCTFRKMS